MRAMSQIIVAGFVLAALAMPANRAGAAVDRPFPLITVTGEGSVMAKPDIAYATAGVASEGKTPREATEANAKTMTEIMSALKDAGIPEADIRTARFSISPIYAQRERGEPRVTGYRASNQVHTTVRDIARVGEILDRLVGAGATNVYGVEFSVSNPSKLLDEARTAAFADAKRKAELLARAAGAQVGRAVGISEDDAQPPMRPYALRANAPAAAAPPTPVAAGEEKLRVQVVVSFELNQ